jgi:hypothetical protein
MATTQMIECYNFIYDVAQVQKVQSIFFDPVPNATHYTIKAYRPAKVSQELKQSMRDALPSKGIFQIEVVHPGTSLQEHIRCKYDLPVTIPQDVWTIYTSHIPGNVEKATSAVLKEELDDMFQDKRDTVKRFIPLENRVVSQIAKQSSHWFHMENDNKSLITPSQIRELIPSEELVLIESRNGYHILLPKKQITKELYALINDILFKTKICTKVSGNMFPTPGTWQNGFPVRLLFPLPTV